MKQLLSILFCIAWMSSFGQNHLNIEKWNGSIHKRFFANDYLWLKTSDTGVWIGGRIDSIREKSVVADGNDVEIAAIYSIKTRRENANYKADGAVIALGGFILPILGITNNLLDHKRPLLPVSNIAFSSVMVVGGLLLTRLEFRIYVLGKRWHLKSAIDDRIRTDY